MRMRRQVGVVPSGAVRAGFGGSQGSSVPLGVAGLSLILGGTGLLARRRIRAGARS
ncbi:LPXTG cell wall anchor domain-containing protein [Actinoallomurus purpureus]|uniref:LPXTG cell wall anchor domain-containing protein n=1 Tax=Actinoallomurus purpureus TaxID=478114 RepID=UPI002092A4E1|nr:LPXTG cell wall anchor domain-containing protein [Actinoallomurus purpureus]MCO6008709.1 LPXTG cell wall anchor domain-containing protein [Actinoallomurus purpureus]